MLGLAALRKTTKLWDLPGPGAKPMCPWLAGGFLSTTPPGKSCFVSFLCVELCTLQGLPPSLLVDFLFRKGRGVNGHFRFDIRAQSQLLFKSSLPFLFGSRKRKRIFSPPSMGDEGVCVCGGGSELMRRDLGNHCRINLQNSTPAP